MSIRYEPRADFYRAGVLARIYPHKTWAGLAKMLPPVKTWEALARAADPDPQREAE